MKRKKRLSLSDVNRCVCNNFNFERLKIFSGNKGMSSSVELLELIFDQESRFMAGQELIGAALVVLRSPIHIGQLVVELKGEARNGWVNKTSDKIYESNELYLSEAVPAASPGMSLAAGRHQLRFSCPLPDNLPSSFEGEFGQIRYSAKATLVLSSSDSSFSSRGREEVVRERFFSVVALLNLHQLPVTRHPVEAIDATEFSCCCVPLGTVSANISIPKNGYLPNEKINISAEIYNGSRKKIKDAQIVLIQHARFLARSRYENADDHKEMHYVIASLSKGDINPRRTMRILNQDLDIPCVIPTYQGNIIKISYILRVEAEPGIEIEIPITIGTLNQDI